MNGQSESQRYSQHHSQHYNQQPGFVFPDAWCPSYWARILLGLCLVWTAPAWAGPGIANPEQPNPETRSSEQVSIASEAAEAEPVIVVLIRHAEKAEEPRRDPPLTPRGEARAHWLGEVLSGAGVGQIYSTDTLRTRSTAGILARTLGSDVTVLPPRDLQAMAAALRSHAGEVVVSVGHSNTLGPLAELLGSDPWEPIGEGDYEGFYVLTVGERETSTLPLRLSMPERETPTAQPETMR